MTARFDRQSISVIVLPALFYVIFVLLVLHRTVRCPNGIDGVVVTRPGLDVKKMCRKVERRARSEDD